MATERRQQQALAIIEEAVAIARTATPEIERLKLLESIGTTLAAVDPARAFALIEDARQEFRQSIGLDRPQHPEDPRAEARRIMSRLKAMGHRVGARYVREILGAPDPEEALAAAREEAEEASSRRVFERWAEAAALAFPERAAEFFSRAEHADWVMANTVRAFARSDPQRALDLARRIGRRWNRVVALCEVADALAGRDPAQAVQLAQEALAGARADEREEYRPWLLRRVVCTLRRTDAETALAVAREIPDAPQRARALTAVAYALVGRGPKRAPEVFEEALSVAREVTEEWARWLESDLAEGWAEVDLTRAIAVARAIASPNARVAALAKVLPALEKSDVDAACEAGDQLIADGQKQVDLWQRGDETTWWEYAFPVLARLDPGRFLAAIERAKNPDTRHTLLSALVYQVALHDVERAKSLAEGLKRVRDRSAAMGGLYDAIAEIDPLRARQLAEQIPDEDDRHRALIAIVQKMTERDPHAALQYLAELHDGSVSLNTAEQIADALAESDPQTAAALAWQMLEVKEQEHRDGLSTREYLESFARWPALYTLTKANPEEAMKLARKMRGKSLRVQMMLHVAEHLLGTGGWSEEDWTEQEPLL